MIKQGALHSVLFWAKGSSLSRDKTADGIYGPKTKAKLEVLLK
ncbi:hypothetical protein P4T73_14855 [Bacillus atrophaeus]|nr:hypothetical protein [Bacillus atrophaeus]